LFIIAMFVFNMIMNGFMVRAGLSQSLVKVLFSNLVMLVVGSLLIYLWIKAGFDAIDGKGFKPFSKETLSFSSFWNFIKTNILMALCMIPVFLIFFSLIFLLNTIGKATVIFIAVALFVVYVYIMVRLFPAFYLSVDKNIGARKSFALAWSLTQDKFLNIFWKNFLILLFMFAGILALFIGTIITYPVGMLVIAMFYRELYKNKFPIDQVTSDIKEVSKPEEIIEIKEEVKEEVKEEETKEEVK